MYTSRRRSRNPTTGSSRYRKKCKYTRTHEFFVHDFDLFMKVRLLDETPAVPLLHTLFSKTRIFIWVEVGETSQLANNGKSITFVLLVVPRLSSIPAAARLQHQDQQVSKFSQKIGAVVRSSHDSTWQACVRGADAERSWLAGHGKAWTSIQIIFLTRCTRRIQRKAFPIGCSPSQFISRTWRSVLAHCSERVKSDSEGDASKVETERDLFH